MASFVRMSAIATAPCRVDYGKGDSGGGGAPSLVLLAAASRWHSIYVEGKTFRRTGAYRRRRAAMGSVRHHDVEWPGRVPLRAGDFQHHEALDERDVGDVGSQDLAYVVAIDLEAEVRSQLCPDEL